MFITEVAVKSGVVLDCIKLRDVSNFLAPFVTYVNVSEYLEIPLL